MDRVEVIGNDHGECNPGWVRAVPMKPLGRDVDGGLAAFRSLHAELPGLENRADVVGDEINCDLAGEATNRLTRRREPLGLMCSRILTHWDVNNLFNDATA